DRLLKLHQPVVALLLDLLRHVTVETVRGGALDIFVFEATDAIQLRLAEPVEEALEVLLRLAGEADDESRANGEIGADLAPFRDAFQGPLLVAGAPHGLEDAGRGVLEGDVEIRKH